jgi:hypothetical protein
VFTGLVNIISRIVSPALESAHGSSLTGQLEWRDSAFTRTEANTGLRSWLKYDTHDHDMTVAAHGLRPCSQARAVDGPPHFQLRLSAIGNSTKRRHNNSFITN